MGILQLCYWGCRDAVFREKREETCFFPERPMLPSFFAIQVTNYRVAQGLTTTMKTSPVVLPHCVLPQVPPLPRAACGGPTSTVASKFWRRAVVELGNEKVSNERPAGAHVGRRNKEIDQPCQLRAKQTPTSRSCVDKEITWVIEIFLAVMTS